MKMHEIEVQEVITVTRVVKLPIKEYPTAQDAENFVAEALANVRPSNVGTLKSETSELLVNGFRLEEFSV